MALAQMTLVGALLRPFDDDDLPANAASTSAGKERLRALRSVEKGAVETWRIKSEREFLKQTSSKKAARPPNPRLFLSHLHPFFL